MLNKFFENMIKSVDHPINDIDYKDRLCSTDKKRSILELTNLAKIHLDEIYKIFNSLDDHYTEMADIINSAAVFTAIDNLDASIITAEDYFCDADEYNLLNLQDKADVRDKVSEMIRKHGGDL